LIGKTGGSRLRISVDGVRAIDCAVGDAEQVWARSLEKHFARRVA
jgi:hypothetical protein